MKTENNMPFLSLAPMAGFTDAPFRTLCKQCGADFTVTEMVSSVATVFNDKKTALLAKLEPGETPAAIQLFGHDPKIMAAAAEKIVSGEIAENLPELQRKNWVTPSYIDINMGCPVKKIVSGGDGSALMKSPELCGEIVNATVKALEKYKIPVSVKIRCGFDKSKVNASEVANICAGNGASMICVHGRTREEMYNPGIHLDVIENVRKKVDKSVLVVGNGDISSVESALAMIDVTGCDGLMIGRAALSNPWIFNEIKCCFANKAFTPPTLEEKVITAISLVKEIVNEKGEFTGVREARGRAAHFIKGIRGSAKVRDRLNHAETLDEFEQIMLELLN